MSKSIETVSNPSRRRLFKGQLAASHSPTRLRLPWVISEEAFINGCTQCQACIESCETQVIKKDEQGFPYVDLTSEECTFCGNCHNACQETLFLPKAQQAMEKPWPISIEINNNCLAKHQIYCQSCRDVCEPEAIVFQYKQSIPTPEINQIDCTLCGACLSSCPQSAIELAGEMYE
ncbi:ferredoxin-type protein NapF [Colwellia sp. MEBiC06753]